jgi:uncharacterized protein YjbJ (UPF0337 family)
MMTLKLALLATTAAGAVAAAGGITYATVGNSSPAPNVQAAKDAALAKARQHVGSVPSAAPTCVPNAPAGVKKAAGAVKSKAGNLADNAQQAPERVESKVPAGVQQAAGNVESKVPAGAQQAAGGVTSKVGSAPDGVKQAAGTAKSKVDAAASNLPKSQLPTCANTMTPDKAAQPKLPASKPDVPTAPSCSSVTPAIALAGERAKGIALPGELHLESVQTRSILIQGQEVCTNTEKFVGGAGSFLTVERLNTPPQVTVQEVAQALKVAPGALVASPNTLLTNQATPLQGADQTDFLLTSAKGYVLRVTGSPTLAPALPQIASKLGLQK